MLAGGTKLRGTGKGERLTMSYNIDRWRTKKLENLVIPIAAFRRHERDDWHPKIIVTDTDANIVTLQCGCEQEIKGTLRDNQLYVTEFDMSGEGSGTFL